MEVMEEERSREFYDLREQILLNYSRNTARAYYADPKTSSRG